MPLLGKLEPVQTGRLRGGLLSVARPLPAAYDQWRQGINFNSNCGGEVGYSLCYTRACTNEQQVLTIVNATGGTFTLTFDPFGGGPETTAAIPYGSTPAIVQAELEALLNVDPGDIEVTGGPDVYTFTASGNGQYACTDIALLEADCTSLTAPAVPSPIDLLTATTYGVLAGTTATNTGATVVDGDLGIHPGAALVGFPPGVVTGATELASAAALQAKTDLTAAYIDAAGRPSDFSLAPDIGGLTLSPGVHTTDGTPASLGITGNVTLDGLGDPNAVFIFQIESTLITAPGSSVTLINGTQACNVFWQVGSSATLGTTTDFKGTILALTAITANNNANVDGRLLARNAAVTLDDNDITVPDCVLAGVISCTVESVVQGSSDSPPNKSIADVGGVNEFEPFMLYRGAECSTWMDSDDLLALARNGYARGEGKAFALQLQTDASGAGNPSLNSSATVISGNADVANTLSALITAACDCGTGDIVLHSHIRAIPFFLERQLIRWDEASGRWYHGPWPFVFDCYSGDGPGNIDEAEDGSNVWVYATGPIEVDVSQEMVPEHDPTVRQNHDLQLVEHLAILRFDPCCVLAALASVF